MTDVADKTPQSPTQTQTPPEEEKILFTWQAPARPFKRRDRRFWTTAGVIGVIFALLLFLAEGVMPVVVIISLVFLFYVLSTVEPEIANFSITSWGIRVGDSLIPWNLLTRFWFSQQFDTETVVFESLTFPGKIELVINSKDKEKIGAFIKKYLPEEKATPSGFDKIAGIFAKKIKSDLKTTGTVKR